MDKLCNSIVQLYLRMNQQDMVYIVMIQVLVQIHQLSTMYKQLELYQNRMNQLDMHHIELHQYQLGTEKESRQNKL